MEKPQRKIKNFLILAILFLLPIYLIKIKFGWISFNVLELLITILFFLCIFNKNTKYQIPNTKYNIPVILIFTGLFLSVVANKNYYMGMGAIKGWFVFPIVFGIIFFDAIKKDESLLRKSLLALFFSGAAVSAMGIVYKFFGLLTYDGRLRIFYDSPNQLAMFLAIPFLIGIYFAFPRSDLRGTRRSDLGIGLAFIGANLYLTFSYGTWLALIAALSVVFWLKYSKITQKKYLAIFIIIVLILLSWASFGKYKSLENLGGRSSLDSRIMIWRSAGRMIGDNPLFGIGPGNFQNKYLEYQKYFPPYLEWAVPQPHNLFLAFWLESGLLGLIGFVWLLILFFRDNKKVYPFTKINKNNNSIYEIKKQTSSSLNDKEYFGGGTIENNRLYGTLCLAIVLYFIIHGLIDTTYWRNDMAVVFWTVVAANYYLALKNESAEQKEKLSAKLKVQNLKP